MSIIDVIFSRTKRHFNESFDTAVFTCVHVINEESPILRVVHDKDGDWQFLCGCEHSVEDARVISLGEALGLDRSVSELAKMKKGKIAERTNKNSNWIIK